MENKNKFNDLSKVPVELYDDGVYTPFVYEDRKLEPFNEALYQLLDKHSENGYIIVSLCNDEVDLGKLNEVFKPDKCNSYYGNGRWLKNLFYKYNESGKYTADGTQSDGLEVEGWDFYKPKDDNDLKFQLELGDGTKVIMLKMWRKNSLKMLYEYVKMSLGMDIDIQPAL